MVFQAGLREEFHVEILTDSKTLGEKKNHLIFLFTNFLIYKLGISVAPVS